MILFGIPGPTSMLIVLVIVLLLFGSRLPSTMRSLGRGVTEFKKGLAGEGDEDDNAQKVKGDDKQSHAQQ